MTALTHAVAAEHRAFVSHIEDLRRLADVCDHERPGLLFDEVDRLVQFLELELLPHAAAEEETLYPAVDELLGAPGATEPMARDHAEIRRLTAELRRHRDELCSSVLPAARLEIRRILYALDNLLGMHVTKEEELYLPVLDRLSPDRADALLAAMHRATSQPIGDPTATVADGLNADGG